MDILWIVANAIYDKLSLGEWIPMYDGLCLHFWWGGGESSGSRVHSLRLSEPMLSTPDEDGTEDDIAGVPLSDVDRYWTEHTWI